jgi:hypothetical protein
VLLLLLLLLHHHRKMQRCFCFGRSTTFYHAAALNPLVLVAVVLTLLFLPHPLIKIPTTYCASRLLYKIKNVRQRNYNRPARIRCSHTSSTACAPSPHAHTFIWNAAS